jgi:hypothetical protein
MGMPKAFAGCTLTRRLRALLLYTLMAIDVRVIICPLPADAAMLHNEYTL